MRQAKTRLITLADGRHLSVDVWDGHGAPVVLLHGLFDCALGWKKLAQVSHRPCYAFDLPGFGGSDCTLEPTMASYAKDIVEALQILGVHDFTLVGHSLGGAIATSIAESIPEEVAALVLMAPAGFGRIHLSEFLHAPVIRDVVKATLPYALQNPLTAAGIYAAVVGNWHRPDIDLLKRLNKNAHRMVPGAVMANEAIIEAGNSPDAFYKHRVGYHGPVLALWGSRDKLVPLAHKEGVEDAFPQAKVTVWAGMAHHAQQERPKQLSGYIDSACGRARRERAANRDRVFARTERLQQAVLGAVKAPQPLPTKRSTAGAPKRAPRRRSAVASGS